MKVIIIDTSTEKSMVLLPNGSKKTLPFGFQSSKCLIEVLNIDFEGVELIGVTTGPGLMTGIRVGMAAAQGLSLGLNVPLVGLSSFEGYLGPDHVVAIDARLSGAYIQEWGQEPRQVSLEELLSFPKIVGPNLGRIDHPHKEERGPDLDRLRAVAIQKFDRRDFALSPIYKNLL